MSDEEFKAAVIQWFETVDGKIDGLRTDLESDIEHLDKRLDAVVARLDEQDLITDRILQKLDRLANHVAISAQASEQALDAVTLLSRRVHKLEHPDN